MIEIIQYLFKCLGLYWDIEAQSLDRDLTLSKESIYERHR